MSESFYNAVFVYFQFKLIMQLLFQTGLGVANLCHSASLSYIAVSLTHSLQLCYLTWHLYYYPLTYTHIKINMLDINNSVALW